MKTLNLLFLLLVVHCCKAQFKLTRLDKSSLPKTVSYQGQPLDAIRWTDNSGDNILITTETGETQSKGTGDDSRDAALYGYHYLVQADTAKLTWKVHDYIKECSVDLKAAFIKNTIAVTDLDKDGKAEIWLMYKTVCRGDVSPSNMKIIMYQGEKKHAVRGTTRVKLSEKDHMGGDYSFDESFKKAPLTFRQYADKLWKKNMIETWD